MLIEYRCYTMRAGNVPAFWQAQAMRGFDPHTRPIMARLIGYFTTLGGPTDQVIHLWRFDNHEDWLARLHGADPSREAYFQVVRPLMLAQESRFMLPAPVPELTPLWGHGHDWLPGQAPLAVDGRQVIVEETTTQLLPGGLPSYWGAQRTAAARDPERWTAGLLGCFFTLVGAQHQVTQLRWHASMEAFAHAQAQAAQDATVQTFEEVIRPWVADRSLRLLRPAPLAAMSPLLGPGLAFDETNPGKRRSS